MSRAGGTIIPAFLTATIFCWPLLVWRNPAPCRQYNAWYGEYGRWETCNAAGRLTHDLAGWQPWVMQAAWMLAGVALITLAARNRRNQKDTA